ncbi:S1C family serine protease [Pseudoramibacter sp.]|jgi:serine protease Do|uniref:S1C family serine protease n=1 Tax=Pseudoramibacter sp. TaxID=2034862 RepID=UPI0025E11CCF|nr:trypsin-like peptidase domain-containing protein [Pseudoramibacter sp.]MCH4072853.1 S1C family serine protease [Pseudoramibacter sp.]MCH4106624.1 S1C family serine protease [Pseudoramibacter sp.]
MMQKKDFFTKENDQNDISDSNVEIFEATKRPRRSSKIILIIICLVVSIVGGAFGSFLMQKISGNQNSSFVYKAANHITTTSSSSSKSALSTEEIAKKASPTVVSITTESKTTSSFLNDYVTQGAGSGVIISSDGYIVTCEHVVSGASSIKVTTSDNKSYNATVVGTNSSADIALIKINASNLTSAVIGDSSKLTTGEKAVAIGNPLGTLSGTVTEGIISATARNITINGQKMNLVQTSAQVSPGNSGGGLFNKYGELIGIVESKSSSSTNAEGLGFAVPSNKALSVAEQLKKNQGTLSSEAAVTTH